MQRVYLETSAVNHFLSEMNGQGAESTRRLQLSKGRCWFISTTVIWELLLMKRRQDLDICLFLSSYLFDENLLKSGAEIILDYIEQGCPSYQELEPFTKSKIGPLWTRACKDRSFYFYIEDPNFFNMTSHLKKISKCFRYITYDRKFKHPLIDAEIKSIASFLDSVYSEQFTDEVKPVVKWLRMISLLLLLIQICLCLDITGDAIQSFWVNKKIEDPFERLYYLLETSPEVLRQGPLWNMANTILFQCQRTGKSSRGALHDGLHSVYLPFIDLFLTKDKHFSALRDIVKPEFKELFYKKIYHIDEVSIIRVAF